MFGRGSQRDSSELELTSWALEQVKSRKPSEEMAQAKVQALVDALAGVRGKAGAQVFGLEANRIEPQGRPALESSIISALGEWQAHFEAKQDSVSLLALDGVGKAYGVPDLCVTERAPLRCDPLGTRDGLAPEWELRLERLEEARAGRRRLDLAAIRYVGADELEAPEIVFGHRNMNTLYRSALRYEAETNAAFPRELAAFWAIADGICVDGDPVLRPIAEWDWDLNDRGLCIGCGSYVQGSLILESPSGAGLMEAAVVDVDDDGEELARYRDFGAFADALLGK